MILQYFQIEIVFHYLLWSDGPSVISDKSMDFNESKNLMIQVFDDLKEMNGVL